MRRRSSEAAVVEFLAGMIAALVLVGIASIALDIMQAEYIIPDVDDEDDPRA